VFFFFQRYHKFTNLLLQLIVGCDSREDAGMEGKERFLTHPAGAGDDVVTQKMWAHSNHPKVTRLFVPFIEQAREFPWYNKPWSYSWFVKNHANDVIGPDDILAIIDPDEVDGMCISPLCVEKGKARRWVCCVWGGRAAHMQET
jgi:hypothetical protein